MTRIAVAQVDTQDRFTVAKNLASLTRLANQAGRMGCDLFATEECALSLFCGEEGALRVPGPETRAVAAWARKHNMYIALGLVIRESETRKRNAQILFDRSGKMLGVYHKMLPTNDEILGGTAPGDDMPVFDLDFGRVACVICYDTQFPEIPRIAGVRNADLILFSHVGGAIMGDFIGRMIAYENTCWVATVGRGCNAFADPRGQTVAQDSTPGRLLVVDADVTRVTLPISPGIPVTPWRVHHLMERRPHICRLLTGPAVDVETEAMPLFIGNAMMPGENALEFALVNRSAERQRGSVTAQFPFPFRVLTDEHIAWYVKRDLGTTDWKPRPRRIAFDLAPGERKRCMVRYTVPDDAEGAECVRISGRTESGEYILWQRQVTRFPEPPVLNVPRVAGAKDVEAKGVRIALDRQFMGGPAKSRTVLRLAHDGRALLLHAVCRKYGPWFDEEGQSPDDLSIPIIPEPGIDRVFWCTLSRTGRQTTQRREGGTPVKGRRPKWTAEIERDERQWVARIRFPFAEFEEDGGAAKGAQRRWRANFQRSAVLPPDAARERCMSEVVFPPQPRGEKPRRVPTEWAVWNPPYSRIDNVKRLGTLLFE